VRLRARPSPARPRACPTPRPEIVRCPTVRPHICPVVGFAKCWAKSCVVGLNCMLPGGIAR
jgi:hypothetical protein